MSNKTTLAAIRKAADKKYGSFEVELSDGTSFIAPNALRLSKAKRKVLTGLSDRLKEEGADQFDVFSDALKKVSTSGHAALMKEIDGDLPVLIGVFEDYMKNTEAGEASASES